MKDSWNSFEKRIYFRLPENPELAKARKEGNLRAKKGGKMCRRVRTPKYYSATQLAGRPSEKLTSYKVYLNK